MFIHQLLRHEAFDESVLGNMIDTETISLIQFSFYPTETRRHHPITTHWNYHIGLGCCNYHIGLRGTMSSSSGAHALGLWFKMATGPLAGFRFSQRDTIQEWNSGSTTIGPISHSMNERVLKSLSQSFTHRKNPHGHGNAKIAFQRDLDELLEADNAYRDKYDKDKGTPCLTRMITHLTCNCSGADINSTYRQCLVSMRNSTTYFTALTLFDTGALTLFVNREVAKWLEQHQHGV